MNSVLPFQVGNGLRQKDALFHKATLQLLQGSLPDQEEMQLLLRALVEEEIVSLEGYLLFLKKTLSFIFLNASNPSMFSDFFCREICLKICRYGSFRRSPFLQSLQNIILFFLKKKSDFPLPEIFPKGGILIEALSLEHLAHLPDLKRGALVSVLCFLLGQMSKNQQWVEAALQIALWHVQLLDQSFSPFTTLWQEEKGFKEKDLLTAQGLMFDALGSCFHLEQMMLAKEKVQKKISILPGEISLPYFYLLLHREIKRWKNREPFLPIQKVDKEKVWFDSHLLLARYSGSHLESAVTFLGNHSTLGEIRCCDVQIRSFGPQWFPLGDSSGFGLLRLPNRKTASDFEWKRKDDGYFFKGWIDLPSPKEECFCAMEAKNSIVGERFSLELDFQGDTSQKLGFVFYVSAKSASVDGKMELAHSALRRYEGAVRSVSFKGKNGSLQVRSQNLSCMHLIPLGESEAFWQSNFLLGYEISFHKGPVTFHIEKVNEEKIYSNNAKN